MHPQEIHRNLPFVMPGHWFLKQYMNPKSHRALNQWLAILASTIVCANAIGATSMVMILVSMVFSLVVIGLAVYAIGFTSLRTALLAITAVSVVLSVWTTNWPAHARFHLAKSSFNKIEVNIRRGHSVATPRWIGTYYVKEIQSRRSAICFWTNLHPYGRTGIVKSSRQRPPLNIGVHLPLNEGWHLVSED